MNLEKAEFFDAQAEASWAMDEYGPEEEPKIERLREMAGIAPGMRILEPGCGTGRLTAVLASWVGETGRVVALDISPAMIAACLPRVQPAEKRVRLMNLALEDLRLPPEFFHRVICHQVFPHFDRQPEALSIINRLLADDGVLLVAHFTSRSEINDTHRKAGTVVERDMLPEDDKMRAMMSEAGFEVESLIDDELGYLLRARKR